MSKLPAEIRDEAAAKELLLERERLLQEALDLRVEMLEAEKFAGERRKAYLAACARLIPIKDQLSQVAA